MTDEPKYGPTIGVCMFKYRTHTQSLFHSIMAMLIAVTGLAPQSQASLAEADPKITRYSLQRLEPLSLDLT